MNKLGFFTLACMMLVSREAEAQLGPPPATGQLPRAQPLPLSGQSQNGTVVPNETAAPGGGANSVNTINPSIQIQGAFQGGVPTGTVSPQPLSLKLLDAVQRGLMHNLGMVEAGEAARNARAQRLAAVAQLLPDVTGHVSETVQQINLVAEGLRISVPIPGFTFPKIVGPFNNFDARANFTENVSLTGLRNWRSSQENARSAALSLKDSRELVALAVSGSYLQIIASAARIQTVRAQIETARTVYQQAVDRDKSGLNARIDVTRSLVELQTQQQRLTSLTNDFEKQKIALARLIGLPMAQAVTLADAIPYREAPAPNLDSLILRAFSTRADVQAAGAQVKAAELAKQAASAERYPSLDLAADYGATGITPTNNAHGTFSATAGVQFPIYRSGRIRADLDQAEAALAQHRAEYEDAKANAEQDVRNAVLDSNAASEQVRVAESNRKLAADTLEQARDRFRAGVSDTVELVQAQESVATAEQDYITALFAYNLAQVSLARAVGQTEQGIASLVEGR
jgi:outer membrane protein TolC